MNTKIEEQNLIPLTPLSVADIFEMLGGAIDHEVDQHNELVSSLEKSEQEKSFLKLQLSTLEGRLNLANDKASEQELTIESLKGELKKLKNQSIQVINNAEKHMDMIEQKTREMNQLKVKFDVQASTLKAYIEIANTPKKVREKIKDLQASNATKLGFIEQHKKSIAQLTKDKKALVASGASLMRELKEVEFNKFYSKNGDNLSIYPLLCEAGFKGELKKQVPIWYMTDEGTGALYMLNEDGEPHRSPMPKGGLKPKKETMDIIRVLLNKFKDNGGVVHSEDLAMLEVV